MEKPDYGRIDCSLHTPLPNHMAFASHLQEEQRKYQQDIVQGLAIPRKLLGGEPNYSTIAMGVSPVRKVMIAIAGFREYQAALMNAARILAQFSVALVTVHDQESVYLKNHKRLPGSLRTSRLRKKRKTQVDHWYRKFKRSKA